MNKQKLVNRLKNYDDFVLCNFIVFSYDFVKIYIGVVSDANLNHSLTGNAYAKDFTITIVGTTVTIHLVSDDSERKAGFQMEYKAGKCVVHIC